MAAAALTKRLRGFAVIVDQPGKPFCALGGGVVAEPELMGWGGFWVLLVDGLGSGGGGWGLFLAFSWKKGK